MFLLKRSTLPPITMEVENGGLEDDWLVSKGAIFHFHDYGRKGKCHFSKVFEVGQLAIDLYRFLIVSSFYLSFANLEMSEVRFWLHYPRNKSCRDGFFTSANKGSEKKYTCCTLIAHMDVSKNRGGKTAQNGWFFSWKTLLKWMIWGYPYFWKHPYCSVSNISYLQQLIWNYHTTPHTNRQSFTLQGTNITYPHTSYQHFWVNVNFPFSRLVGISFLFPGVRNIEFVVPKHPPTKTGTPRLGFPNSQPATQDRAQDTIWAVWQTTSRGHTSLRFGIGDLPKTYPKSNT